MAWRLMRGLIKTFAELVGRASPVEPVPVPSGPIPRGPTDHVILLDGTMGSLHPSRITSIGLIHHLLRGAESRASVYYAKGVEWREWREVSEVIMGWGVERQIRRAYGWLASHYREGDRIFIIGYSRGAFAARSLAGLIGRVGLVRADQAVERNIRLAWRYYERRDPAPPAFRKKFCHPETPIEMVGAFDTVRGLGLKLPFLWMFHDEARILFHDHHLGPYVRHGFHALALDETRSVFEPLLWDSAESEAGRIEQVWFRGTHGDIGGQLGDYEAARPLANIPLVWMLTRLEHRGFTLPIGWRDLFPMDPTAPSLGTWRVWGKMFLLRAPRVVGNDLSEKIHESADGHRRWQTILSPRFARALQSLPRTLRAPVAASKGAGMELQSVIAADPSGTPPGTASDGQSGGAEAKRAPQPDTRTQSAH